MCSERTELLKKNLDLAEALLLRILRNPKLLETIPNEATLLLYPLPVEVKRRLARQLMQKLS